jgi:hypothetical protein
VKRKTARQNRAVFLHEYACYRPLLRVAGFGASSFSFSRASGIMRPNIELNIAVGMRPRNAA